VGVFGVQPHAKNTQATRKKHRARSGVFRVYQKIVGFF
jgi:hypothetical protein